MEPNKPQEQNTIKLIRGQRGNYGWEIRLVGDDEKDISKRLKSLNEQMVTDYNNLNTKKEVKNNGTK